MRIGYVGKVGAYAYEIASELKGKDDELVEFSNVKDAIVGIEQEKVDRCIASIENSVNGNSADTVDAILQSESVYIIDEIEKRINNVLMAKARDIRIAKICATQQVLEQCREYLNENYFGTEKVAVASISDAASLASKESSIACIGNLCCKDVYGLEVIKDGIQDDSNIISRYVVLSKHRNSRDTKKTALVFSAKNEPGALYKILGLFSIANVNLTRIESIPPKVEGGEYTFLIVIDADEKQKEIVELFKMVKEFCNEFRILGSY